MYLEVCHRPPCAGGIGSPCFTSGLIHRCENSFQICLLRMRVLIIVQTFPLTPKAWHILTSVLADLKGFFVYKVGALVSSGLVAPSFLCFEISAMAEVDVESEVETKIGAPGTERDISRGSYEVQNSKVTAWPHAGI